MNKMVFTSISVLNIIPQFGGIASEFGVVVQSNTLRSDYLSTVLVEKGPMIR